MRPRAQGNLDTLFPVRRLLYGATPSFQQKKFGVCRFARLVIKVDQAARCAPAKAKAEMQVMMVRGDNVSQVFDACAARSGER